MQHNTILPAASLFLVLGALSAGADERTAVSRNSNQRSEAQRLESLEKQVDALKRFYRIRWPREAVDKGYDPVDLQTWTNSTEAKDRLMLIRVQLELIESRIPDLLKPKSTQQQSELDLIEERYSVIHGRIAQIAESYSELIETLRGFGGIIAGTPMVPVPQPATGTVEVLNYVPHFQRFCVNNQVQEVPAATIRRVSDVFGRLLHQETIPGMAVFENVTVGVVQVQLNNNPVKVFEDWKTTPAGSYRMCREIR